MNTINPNSETPWRVMRHLTKSIPFAALAVVLCLAWAGDAAAQDSCSFNQNATPGLAYPVMDWRVINNGILPQVYSWTATEDVVDIRVEDGNSIGLDTDIDDVLRS